MLRVAKALMSFWDRLSGKRAAYTQIDKTVVSFLSKGKGGGGGRATFLSLSRLARRILLWSQRHRISTQPVYEKGIRLNSGRLSVLQQRDAVAPVTSSGKDLTLTSWGHEQSTYLPPRGPAAQLRRYMTLDQMNTQACVVDALPQSWNFPFSRAFPPSTLVSAVLNVKKGSNCRMLLVAPCWIDTPWLPMLMKLQNDIPCQLPLLPDLINAETGYPASKLDNLRLVVRGWPVGLQQTFSLLECSWRSSASISISKSWTHVYTDGSADNAIWNGGAGVYIQYPRRQRRQNLPRYRPVFCKLQS